jgi:hypothetical protein
MPTPYTTKSGVQIGRLYTPPRQGRDCPARELAIQMTEDPADMEPPWWELAAIGVAFTAVFLVGVFVGRFTA